jgi:hypothetical protein
MALTHRLHELRLTTDWEYRQACVHLSRLGYRSSEPNGIPRESSQVLSKVLQAVREDFGSTVKLARDLNINADELNEHVFGLAPVGLDGGALRSEPIRPDLQLFDGLYPHRRLFTAMAVTSLVVVGAPLALVDRRLGRLWALGAFAMHWGILAVMGIRFRYQLSGVAFASWFDFERALRRVAS